jgi:UDP-2,3-diacylglucosamine hydrolase
MTILFISDLHLDDYRSDITDIFLRFLKTEAKKAEALYILGDFFEFWIGDDDPSPFAKTIKKALLEATQQGLPIYLQHGNRDFLLKKKFFRATGCTLIPEEYVMDVYGVPTLLMHGDTLCLEDVSYIKARKYVRNRFVQMIFLWKSLKKRKMIVEGYRNQSKMHTQNASDSIMDVTPAEVERIMLKHNVQHLIHGHTHRQAQHAFTLNHLPATRTVLGDWHDKGNMLVCHSDGRQEFINLY